MRDLETLIVGDVPRNRSHARQVRQGTAPAVGAQAAARARAEQYLREIDHDIVRRHIERAKAAAMIRSHL